jgi:hypothetical protein
MADLFEMDKPAHPSTPKGKWQPHALWFTGPPGNQFPGSSNEVG